MPIACACGSASRLATARTLYLQRTAIAASTTTHPFRPSVDRTRELGSIAHEHIPGKAKRHTMDEQATTTDMPNGRPDLAGLSPADLIARITLLEERLKDTTARLTTLAEANADTNANISTGSTATGVPSRSKPSAKVTSTKVKKAHRPFDFSRYSTRHIALKFAYLGQRYNGFEHTNGGIAPERPTIEEALWKALRKARLIPPDVPEGVDGSFEVVFDKEARKNLYWWGNTRLEIDWTGLRYSKCGRTDKGVSAFGQVVGITVRSNRPKARMEEHGIEGSDAVDVDENNAEDLKVFDDVKDELPYISILNGILPPDIRVLAWCSNADESFDARFGCRERRYKYFFTNPAFCPTPGSLGLSLPNGEKAPIRDGWLDIEAMRKAAKKLQGLHDYRNFCKIDASKQMSSCERRITFANIEEMPAGIGMSRFVTDPRLSQSGNSAEMLNGTSRPEDDEQPGHLGVHGPRVYTFAVHGTAFLWHQVRCMVAVLFLVGQGLEQPEIVDELLDIAKNPGKPQYEMANDTPLVLWNCVFPGDEPGDEGGLRWIYAGDEASVPALVKKGESPHDGKFGMGGLVSDLWIEWREAKMKETVTAGLLSLALSQGDETSLERGGLRGGTGSKPPSQRVFDGSNSAKNVGDYTPVMQKPRMDTLEALNAKYLAGKQARRDLKKSETVTDE